MNTKFLKFVENVENVDVENHTISRKIKFLKIMQTKNKIDSNFQTPLDICDYMISMIPDNVVNVLEPTPGLGNIVKTLESKNKYEIIQADDFFLLDKNIRYDCIVMNPPFSSKSAFIDNAPDDLDLKGMKIGYHILSECLKMSDNVIALMPWFTISDSDVRMRLLKSFGLKSISPLPRKTFQYARIQTVIIELEKGYDGITKFKTNHF